MVKLISDQRVQEWESAAAQVEVVLIYPMCISVPQNKQSFWSLQDTGAILEHLTKTTPPLNVNSFSIW